MVNLLQFIILLKRGDFIIIGLNKEQLSVCPSCSESSLKIENGCHSCINEECGFSKCDV